MLTVEWPGRDFEVGCGAGLMVVVARMAFEVGARRGGAGRRWALEAGCGGWVGRRGRVACERWSPGGWLLRQGDGLHVEAVVRGGLGMAYITRSVLQHF